MPTGVAPSPELGALAGAIEAAFPDWLVTYNASSPGGQQICQVLLAYSVPLDAALGVELGTLVYASGVTQAEALDLQGLLVRWPGLGRMVRQEALEPSLGGVFEDTWIAAYSCALLGEFREPGGYQPPLYDTPAADLELDVRVQDAGS